MNSDSQSEDLFCFFGEGFSLFAKLFSESSDDFVVSSDLFGASSHSLESSCRFTCFS